MVSLRVDFYDIDIDDYIVVSFKAKRRLVEKLDSLVDRGLFPSRSEAIRVAITTLLTLYLKGEELEEVYSEKVEAARAPLL